MVLALPVTEGSGNGLGWMGICNSETVGYPTKNIQRYKGNKLEMAIS
jgi:hypothetical protein